MARLFAETVTDEKGEISFVLKENLWRDPLLQGDCYFGYVGQGWTRYGGGGDWILIPLMMSSIVIIIALSPMFSEDYARRTADIILPAARGRMQLWWVRTGAGCLFASVCYWLCGLILAGIQLGYYGWSGLRLGASITVVPVYWRTTDVPLWQFIVMQYLAGWFSVAVLALLVQAVSAWCRQSFISLLCSLCVYFGPVGIGWLVLDKLLEYGPPSFEKALMTLKVAVWSMPLSYCSMLMDVSSCWKWKMTAFLSAAAVAALLFGMRYCRHQIK